MIGTSSASMAGAWVSRNKTASGAVFGPGQKHCRKKKKECRRKKRRIPPPLQGNCLCSFAALKSD